MTTLAAIQEQKRNNLKNLDSQQVNSSLLNLQGKISSEALSKAHDSNSSSPRFIIRSSPRNLSVNFKNPADRNPSIAGVGSHGNLIEIDISKGSGKIIKDKVVAIVQAERQILSASIAEMKKDPNEKIQHNSGKLSKEPQSDGGMLYRGQSKDQENTFNFAIKQMKDQRGNNLYQLSITGYGQLSSISPDLHGYVSEKNDAALYKKLEGLFYKLAMQYQDRQKKK